MWLKEQGHIRVCRVHHNSAELLLGSVRGGGLWGLLGGGSLSELLERGGAWGRAVEGGGAGGC